MKKTRLFSLLLVAVMLAASVTTAMAASWEDDYYHPPKINEGQYPFTTKEIKLEYWITISKTTLNIMDSYDGNACFTEVQKATGVSIEFIHPAVGQEKEQFNTMLASGILPDMICLPNEGYYVGGLKAMYEDGAIIDVAPYLDQYAPQFKEVLYANEDAVRQFVNDGQIYGFPELGYDGAMPYNYALVHADWLEEFGMQQPRTIEEYEAYFDAILANKPGVVPVYIDWSNSGLIMPFTSAFDFIKDYMVEDGKVSYYLNDPELKDFLELMHNWYEKGYISEDFVSLSESDVFARFDSGKLGMYVGSVDAALTRAKQADYAIDSAPYMRKTVDSPIHTDLIDNPNKGYITVITSACQNPEAAVAFLNYAYTEEGALLYNFGIEGLNWDYAENGFPMYTELMTNHPSGLKANQVGNYWRVHFASKYLYYDLLSHPTVSSDVEARTFRTKWYDDANVDCSLRLPAIALTTEESTERGEIIAELNTYVEPMIYKFITGAASLDTFDAFVAKCESMKLGRAIELTQAAYDRYMAK